MKIERCKKKGTNTHGETKREKKINIAEEWKSLLCNTSTGIKKKIKNKSVNNYVNRINKEV